MSAIFVARANVDAAVGAFIAHEGPLSLEAATALGRALWAMNAEAVRWSYDLGTGTPEERAEHEAALAAASAYAWTPCDLSVAVMVNSLECLHQQCCEGHVRDTPLSGRLTALANHYDASSLRETNEYDRTPWGPDEDLAPELPEPPPAAPAARPVFRSELTPEGEQLVIPGCERNGSKRMQQLDLFC